MCLPWRPIVQLRTICVHLLSRPRRRRRPHEWSSARAVTFIVTLAATRCVTLAAQAAGMGRKSAYALKDRDRALAEAWNAALKASDANRPKARAKGDKSSSDNPRPSPTQDD